MVDGEAAVRAWWLQPNLDERSRNGYLMLHSAKPFIFPLHPNPPCSRGSRLRSNPGFWARRSGLPALVRIACQAGPAALRCLQFRVTSPSIGELFLRRHLCGETECSSGHSFCCRVVALGTFAPAYAQIGKYVPIPAGSDADHALTEINATTDPAQKLALIDKFAANIAQGDLAIVADDLYVNYYIAAKNYDKAFEYGDKLFALDPDSFANGVNMVRAAQEKGDTDKLVLVRRQSGRHFEALQGRSGSGRERPHGWDNTKKQTLENAHDSIVYVQQLVFNGAYQTPDVTKRAALLHAIRADVS